MLTHKSPLFLSAIYFLIGMLFYLFYYPMIWVVPFFIYWSCRYFRYLLLLFIAGIFFSYLQIQLPNTKSFGQASIKVLKIAKGKWGGFFIQGLLKMKDQNKRLVAKNIYINFPMKTVNLKTKKIISLAELTLENKHYHIQLKQIQAIIKKKQSEKSVRQNKSPCG